MDDRKASLGCGTLILIALIVLILGNTGSKEALGEIRALRSELGRVSRAVDGLERELGEVRRLLEAR